MSTADDAFAKWQARQATKPQAKQAYVAKPKAKVKAKKRKPQPQELQAIRTIATRWRFEARVNVVTPLECRQCQGVTEVTADRQLYRLIALRDGTVWETAEPPWPLDKGEQPGYRDKVASLPIRRRVMPVRRIDYCANCLPPKDETANCQADLFINESLELNIYIIDPDQPGIEMRSRDESIKDIESRLTLEDL